MAKDGTETEPETRTSNLAWHLRGSKSPAAVARQDGAAGEGLDDPGPDERTPDEKPLDEPTTTEAPEISTYGAIRDYGVEEREGSERAKRSWIPRGKPFESLGASARHHWQFVATCSLVGILFGAAFGFAKTPNYTAESRLFVGKTAQLSNLASIPGLDAAGQSLADSYSRLATTDEVLQQTAKGLGGRIDGTLSASPIPQSPIVRVEGTAATNQGALAIARAGAKALVAAVDKLNAEQSKSADELLQQHNAADLELVAARVTLQGLQNQYTQQQASGTGAAALAALQQQVNAAQAAVDGFQVKVNALSAAYSGVFNPSVLNTQVLQVVGNPKATGSDRKSTLQLGLIAGLVAGCLLGLGLAALIDWRARRTA